MQMIVFFTQATVDILQRDADNLASWCSNLLCISVKKTKSMLVGREISLRNMNKKSFPLH